MILTLLVSALFSEVIGTMAGFGSATVFLPLALLSTDPKTALALSAFMHFFGNLGRSAFFRGHADRRLLMIFGVPSVLATAAGAALAVNAPQDLLKLLLGVFLVPFAVAALAWPTLHLSGKTHTAVSGGVASGFLAGLIGTGGAMRGAFLTGFGLEKDAYIATAAALAIFVDVTRIPIYLSNGFLSAAYFIYVPLLLPVALAGSYIGKRIVGRIPQRAFRTMVLVALILAGAKFVFDGVNALR